MKVVRLGTPNTEGLLQSGEVMYFEKLDGSNGSFRKEIEGEVVASSHNRVLDESSTGDNRGFCKWAKKNVNYEILPFGLEFYGEWLVSHTVQYNEDAYGKFYLYDIRNLATGEYLPEECIESWAMALGLTYLPPLYKGEFKGNEHLISVAEGTSTLGENQMEGIVIKNYSFINKFGMQQHGKYVNPNFSENSKQKPMKLRDEMFGDEMDICERFITVARVRKMIEKGVEQGFEDTGDMTLMKFVPKLILDDVMLEESYTICTEYNKVNFKQLKKFIPKHTAKVLEKYILEKALQ
jgi:hypothetical protein